MLKEADSLKYILFIILSVLFIDFAFAKKNKRTWNYPLNWDNKFEVLGSKNAYDFTFDLKKDADVIREIKNNTETGVIGYLLYEDGKIVIDESDIPTNIGDDPIIDGMLPSHSMGKSLVSYVTGHAICEGYIESVNEKLTGWKTIKNTLFENQTLIDLLNMQAGDDQYIGDRLEPQQDNILKKDQDVNVNSMFLVDVMEKYFQTLKEQFHFTQINLNIIIVL